jgi:hypothetical protein
MLDHQLRSTPDRSIELFGILFPLMQRGRSHKMVRSHNSERQSK